MRSADAHGLAVTVEPSTYHELVPSGRFEMIVVVRRAVRS